jgi:hypothetical protein
MSTSSPPQTPVSVGAERSAPLKELAGLFLRLGKTAFRGPAAHIAMMEEEVVRRRGWLSRGAFLDLQGTANLIPGPSSTELAIYIGYQRSGAEVSLQVCVSHGELTQWLTCRAARSSPRGTLGRRFQPT